MPISQKAYYMFSHSVIPCFLSEDPGWGSCSLGVFICLDCSGIHRNVPDISKIKSLSLSHWEDHEVQVRQQNRTEEESNVDPVIGQRRRVELRS